MEPGNVVAEGMLTDRPFTRPFWGLVGDFDTGTIGDYYPETGAKVWVRARVRVRVRVSSP